MIIIEEGAYIAVWLYQERLRRAVRFSNGRARQIS
jgi:hypothetical protein